MAQMGRDAPRFPTPPQFPPAPPNRRRQTDESAPDPALESPLMARRSPARYLAPLALVATAVALFLIVSPSPDEEREASPNRTSESNRPNDGEEGEAREDGERKGPRRYTVRPGDTPSAIAERTGVPLETLLELNPDLDPQSLNPGQRIKLRESGQ
jgi:hypothetical protein